MSQHDEHEHRIFGRCDACPPPVVRPGPCQHPGIPDAVIRRYATPDVQSLGESLWCDDCGEVIYPSEGVDDDIGWAVTAYIGEPYGAGM